jgi:ParB/RepB/Spo0J family partition protein
VAKLQFVQDQAKWDLRTIPIADIREASEALRSVDRSAEEYIELKDSIAKKGILMPVLVRELKDPETKKKVYQLVDGLQRFTACSELGMKNIPANVVDMEEGEVFEAQLIANAKRVETKNYQFARHMVIILGQNPTMTTTELAERLAVSKSWVDSHLHLAKLVPSIGELVDSGKIVGSNAIALAKLPPDEQLLHLEDAQTESPQTFVGKMADRLKQIKEANRKGRDASPPSFQQQPHLRKPAAIKAEFQQPTVAPAIVKAEGATDAVSGFLAGVAWCLQMDKPTVDAARQKWEDDRRKDEERKEQKKREKDELKRLAAEKAAEEIRNQEQGAEGTAAPEEAEVEAEV